METRAFDSTDDDPPLEGALVDAQEHVELLVKAGVQDSRMVPVKPGDKLLEILAIFAMERGCEVDELVIFREEDGAVLSSLLVIDAEYPCRRRHHVHHARDLAVTVHYQANSHHHQFARHTTVEDVLIWAIKAFEIDPSMAAEFELALVGQETELPGTEHIGHLAGHCQHALVLNLIRGAIANGGVR